MLARAAPHRVCCASAAFASLPLSGNLPQAELSAIGAEVLTLREHARESAELDKRRAKDLSAKDKLLRRAYKEASRSAHGPALRWSSARFAAPLPARPLVPTHRPPARSLLAIGAVGLWVRRHGSGLRPSPTSSG